ncbi:MULTISPECIES: hypothetical protein [Chromobacterium]|uniref:hypothetical protein n=1 Tax=Chromobacterium TaxID=535 RepID=UPI001D05D75F|nr:MULTISPECIES: hypothetical protein [Chromobacterium]UJB32912.1 hypothetical protein HQN78_18775 [Chromobacterium sp. Beijing]
MKNLLTILVMLSSNLYAGNLSNKDVKSFMDNAEICEHLLGEVSGDGDARQMDVIKDANKHCERADKLRRQLLVKYKNDHKVIKAIRQFDEVLDYKD